MRRFLTISSVAATGAGVVMILGGAWAVWFTYQNVVQEKITTPSDASIPNAPVRGPLTLKSQADIIRKHTLQRTQGLTYAEIARDDEWRGIWITATTLRTALHLGIITYLFAGLIILFGAISLWTGVVFWRLAKVLSGT